ncbi:MAG: MFS transporter [Deltaproteobacteria bacterium]|nr:MFS transporter [Deltaproteobacteria bacterium]
MLFRGTSATLQVVALARFLSAIGYFVLVVLQAILFLEPPFEFSPYQIALLLGIFGFGNHGLALFWAPIVPRYQFRGMMLLAYVLAVGAFAGVYFFPSFLWCVVMYFCAGLGLSLTNLITKLWAASLEDEKERISAFSLFYRASNAGGGIAPVIAFALPYQHSAREIFLGVAACYFVVLAACFFFFHPGKKPVEAKVTATQLVTSLYRDFAQYRTALIFLFIMLLYTCSYFQIEIVPYYLKQYEQLPSFIGWVLAVNPIMIVCLQGYFSKAFFWLHKRKESSGFILGFLCVAAAFIALVASPSAYRLWWFIVLFAMGEMFIAPHVDFMISLKSPKTIQPFLMSLVGIMVALGSLTMGAGVVAMTKLVEAGFPALSWWSLNALLFVGIVVIGSVMVFKKTKTPLIDELATPSA